eukprot:m.601012 g.601012  ORF g.601012 m.601012 type:complete len:51 (-) comp58086_c0_seq26:729-881(-)
MGLGSLIQDMRFLQLSYLQLRVLLARIQLSLKFLVFGRRVTKESEQRFEP